MRASKRLLRVQDSASINSNDTEAFVTPPRKRLRRDSSSQPSSSSSTGSTKRRKIEQSDVKSLNIEKQLQLCAVELPKYSDILNLKNIPTGCCFIVSAIKDLFRDVMASIKQRADANNEKLLENELYLDWLQELNFVIDAIENALNFKVPGTRKRVPGLGRSTFVIMYHLIDEFISQIEGHHDGWSYHLDGSQESLYPDTMSLVEECNDPSTDHRSAETVRIAEEVLHRYDTVMAAAVRRFRVESKRNDRLLAARIGKKEYSLSKACCLLSEQTGFGGDDDSMGDSLLQTSRTVMRVWNEQSGGDYDGIRSDSDCDSI